MRENLETCHLEVPEKQAWPTHMTEEYGLCYAFR